MLCFSFVHCYWHRTVVEAFRPLTGCPSFPTNNPRDLDSPNVLDRHRDFVSCSSVFRVRGPLLQPRLEDTPARRERISTTFERGGQEYSGGFFRRPQSGAKLRNSGNHGALGSIGDPSVLPYRLAGSRILLPGPARPGHAQQAARSSRSLGRAATARMGAIWTRSGPSERHKTHQPHTNHTPATPRGASGAMRPPAHRPPAGGPRPIAHSA